MRRRKLLAAGAAITLSVIAGCSGDDNGDGPASTPTSDPDEETPEPPEEPGDGDLSFSAESSATEIDWGEEYSVTVTARAGESPPHVMTALVYQSEADSTWSGSFGNGEMLWRLDGGESRTETFELKPPEVGECKVGLMTQDGEVIEEWELTVNPPTAEFGETISYYDGLDVTVDAELHDSMDFEITWDYGDESGVYSVRPKDGQWVKVSVVAKNTNTNEDVRVPGEDRFSGLAGSSQLNSPRSLGTEVGAGTEYEIDDETRHEEGAWMEMYKDGAAQQEGYWYPPSELIAGAEEKGWILFETDKKDISVDDVEIRSNRNDIRATWS